MPWQVRILYKPIYFNLGIGTGGKVNSKNG